MVESRKCTNAVWHRLLLGVSATLLVIVALRSHRRGPLAEPSGGEVHEGADSAQSLPVSKAANGNARAGARRAQEPPSTVDSGAASFASDRSVEDPPAVVPEVRCEVVGRPPKEPPEAFLTYSEGNRYVIDARGLEAGFEEGELVLRDLPPEGTALLRVPGSGPRQVTWRYTAGGVVCDPVELSEEAVVRGRIVGLIHGKTRVLGCRGSYVDVDEGGTFRLELPPMDCWVAAIRCDGGLRVEGPREPLALFEGDHVKVDLELPDHELGSLGFSVNQEGEVTYVVPRSRADKQGIQAGAVLRSPGTMEWGRQESGGQLRVVVAAGLGDLVELEFVEEGKVVIEAEFVVPQKWCLAP